MVEAALAEHADRGKIAKMSHVRSFYHSHLTRVSRNNPESSRTSRRASRNRRNGPTYMPASPPSFRRAHQITPDLRPSGQDGVDREQHLPRLLPGAHTDLPLLAQTVDIRGVGAQVPAESLEQFAWLMLRGIEIRKVSRKSPATKTPYKRYLYMNPQRTALLSSKVAHASVNNTEGVRTQSFLFTQIQTVQACERHHCRLKLLYNNNNRGSFLLQFEVDTPRSRDILVRMLSKLVHHFANISGRSRVPVSVLASESASDFDSETLSPSATTTVTTTTATKRKHRRRKDKKVEVQVVLPGVECAVCLSAIEDPVQLPCTHMYCRGCLASWRDAAIEMHNRPSCPECRGRIPHSVIKMLPPIKCNSVLESESGSGRGSRNSRNANRNLREAAARI